MLVAAWVFYQVFDAAQTAKARRDGLPLPNPFGLNDLGTRLGMTPPASPYRRRLRSPARHRGARPGPAAANPNPDPGQSSGPTPGQLHSRIPPAYPASYAVPPDAPGQSLPGMPPYSGPMAIEPWDESIPLGAVVLIVIGLVLLLHTLGIFEDEWIGRAWPLILIGVGAWLLYRRTRDLPRGGPR